MIVCLGGGCAFGPCADSKALTETLVDIYANAEIDTTIGRAIKPGTGCHLCDVIAKLPVQQRKKKLHEDEVRKGEAQLTRVQIEKAAQSTTTERS